jgi:hypothetical protein
MKEWLTEGPPFRAGDALTDHVEPVRRETSLGGADQRMPFAERFWGDGTPRLTAYEYQGLVSSRCYREGSLTCQSCHDMHGEDIRGQMRAGARTNAACTKCHERYAGADLTLHTKHAAGASGSLCYSCHMPKIVYGVLDIHRSHRIDIPSPVEDARAGRPQACTLCHLDKSPAWAARELGRLWGRQAPAVTARMDGAPPELADGAASILAGDASQRAIYAHAAGRPESALDARENLGIRLLLAFSLGDRYPAVRWFAWRSLLDLERAAPVGIKAELERFDHAQDPTGQQATILSLIRSLGELGAQSGLRPSASLLVTPDGRPDLPGMSRLSALQVNRPISIGE